MSGNSEHSIAQSYAQLLFELAKQQDCFDQLDSELTKLVELLDLETEFASMLNSPFEQPEKKIDLAQKIFGERISNLALGVFFALIRTGKVSILKDVSELYRLLIDSDSGKPLVNVTLAAEIDEIEKNKIEKKIVATLGKTVRVKYDIDPEIIGGIIVRHNGNYVDNSLLRVLNDAKKLLQNRMSS